jgi:hypothetical protein
LLFDLDIYQETDGSNRPHLTSLLEATAVEFLCRLQEENCLNKISDLYHKIPQEYFANPNDVQSK